MKLLIALFFVAACFCAEKNKTDSKRVWKPRSVNVDTSSLDMMKITSNLGNSTSRTISQWSIASVRGGDLRIRSSYFSADKTDSSKEIEGSSFMTRFSAIVEYMDKNSNGAFDAGEGLKIYRIGLGSENAGRIPSAPIAGQGVDWTRNYTAAGADGLYKFSAVTVDGVFGVSVQWAAAEKTIDGVIVPPTQVKFDVNLQIPASWYNDTTGKSRIAILARVSSSNSVRVADVDSSQKSAKVTRQISSGSNALSWADTVTADGKEVSIKSSDILPPAKVEGDLTADSQRGTPGLDKSSETPSFVMFNIDAAQPKSVKWDPTIGLSADVDSSTSASAATIAFSTMAIVMTVFAVLLA